MLGYNSAKERLVVEGAEAFDSDLSAREKIVAEFLGTERADTTAEWKRKDGRTIPAHNMAGNAMEPQRGDECIEVTAEDITARIMPEEQLVQAQEFEAIGQLAGGIAHDLSNMIGAILG